MRRQRIKLDRINKIFQDLQEQEIAYTVCTSNYLLGKLLTGQIHYAVLLILSNPVNPVISSVLIPPGPESNCTNYGLRNKSTRWGLMNSAPSAVRWGMKAALTC